MIVNAQKLSPAQRRDAIDVLINSFADDNSKIFYFPNAEERRRRLPWLIERMFAMAFEHRSIFVHLDERERPDGVAIWLPPGVKLGYRAMMRHGLLAAPFRLGLRAMFRMTAALDATSRRHDALLGDEPHYYLFYLGVDPDSQGRGVGSKLLAHMAERADAEGRPLYLDTFSDSNVDYYSKRGYDVVWRALIHEESHLVYGMLRRPGGSAAALQGDQRLLAAAR